MVIRTGESGYPRSMPPRGLDDARASDWPLVLPPRWWVLAIAALAALWVLLRSNWSGTPDGDPALHLRLIKDIFRSGQLPTDLPNFPARIAEGGTVEAMFPYAYTPLFHLTGAFAYAIGGLAGVVMINVIAAGAVALVTARFVGRRAPALVAGAAVFAMFLSPHVQSPFTGIYMEPMMLALTFGGAWQAYNAAARRDPRTALIAGLLLGLAIGTRQSALVYVAVLFVVLGLHLLRRSAWLRMRSELRWVAVLCASTALTAAPSLLYLAIVTGSVGYGDLALPGMGAATAVDPAANAYISGITKPDSSTIEWVARYQDVLLYSDKWLPLWLAALPLMLFAVGGTWMVRRGGASRFFAQWALVQCVTEVVLFVTLHGNARYIMLSQMLFFAVVPVGAWVIGREVWAWGAATQRRPAAFALAVGLAVVTAFSLMPPGYVDNYTDNQDRQLRAFRGRAYADMGAWVNANTPPGSLILAPRAYSAELTFERDVTWVTFYGNKWVVDAISTPDAARAHDILSKYGVDYVLVADPPGTYVDRMPADGMRSFLVKGYGDTRYFTLEYMTSDDDPLVLRDHVAVNGLRLYRVDRLETPQ